MVFALSVSGLSKGLAGACWGCCSFWWAVESLGIVISRYLKVLLGLNKEVK